ncbi:cytochrome c-type biogenesis protein [Pseudidiomarina mangrovi]|uniref:cytochrome c-type biogenesis protein n=1 Tax=Pseudidiomarina mangrovi TaxID=2487133 RepID=UPI00196A1E3B|nr:cytochrome c-type biogenesis protein [Pseudidiomarina mangrovi]
MSHLLRLLALLVLLAMLPSTSHGANLETYQFSDPAKEALFRELIGELRCPKCQNQAIADSDAPLAKDLRDQTYTMVQEGATKQQVIDYMVARYGDFAHYQPPVTAATLILWLGPLALLIIGALVISVIARQRRDSSELTAEEAAALAQLRQSSPAQDQ